MSVVGFQRILEGSFADYMALSKQLGGEIAEHSALVHEAFKAQLQYLVTATQYGAPDTNQQVMLLRPTSLCISKIQSYRNDHRTSPYFHHLSAVSESIPALGWVAVSPAPAPFIKEMRDSGEFYTNRVLKEFKDKDKKHMEWGMTWVRILSDLQAFVKQFHTTGLVWSGKRPPVEPAAAAAAGSGGPAPPPPPPAMMMADAPPPADSGTDRSALFAQINQGEHITRSLKKVTDDMQTHKNPTLRTGPAPFKTPEHANQFTPLAAPAADKAPIFARDGKKWLIEYQKGNHHLLVENAEMNNVVYLFKCIESTVTVKGKINSIILDSCKKTSIIFDSVVAAMEFINCQSVQMQVFGKVPTISIDKTDGCQIYLSKDSLNVEIISSKSSEMNVLLPTAGGDYVEYPVPEQYKTVVVLGKGLSTIVVEQKG